MSSALVASSVLILSLLLGVRGQGPAFQPCDGITLQRCQADFNDREGFAADLGLQRYQDLRTAIEAEYSRSPPVNYIQLCRNFKYFKTCFPSFPAYDSCMFPLGLVADANGTATGITLAQARGYSKIWTQLDFICGAGYAIFVNNPGCIANAFANRTTQLNSCQSSFDSSVSRDPDQVCAYAEIAKNCYAQQFALATCDLPGQWYACEYERIGTAVQYPQCTQNFCTTAGADASRVEMAFGSKALEL